MTVERNSIPSSSLGNNSNTTQLSKGLTKELANNSTELANDCISRQAAIDAVRHAWAKGLEPSQYIEELPSAQPERSPWFRIGEICADESKGFISAGRAFEKIRELLREAERREDG